MKKFLGVLILLLGFSFAAEKAKLSVVTDMPTAKVYINGTFAGYDSVQNYEVDAGQHYVVVEYRNKKIFARTYNLKEGEVKTIPTAHFVDFRTDVASRGAVDVEAARIRETRGNFGIGVQASSLADSGSLSGISAKYWVTERIGLQGFGFIGSEAGGIKYQSGGRVLWWLADKVVFNAPFSGYLYAGGGSDNLVVKNDSDKSRHKSITNGGFGVELSIFGVNGLFLGLELGLERQYTTYSDSGIATTDEAGMVAGGGLHFYF